MAARWLSALTMATTGSAILKQVRAKADMSGDGVYVLAQIPAPATPSPMPPPGQPSNLKVELDGNGALRLRWKCGNPRESKGTLYQVYRCIGTAGDFVYLGGSGAKEFVDATVPTGATRVTYQIQAVRSTAVGMWATFVVLLGSNAGGTMTASVTETAAAKIAA